jgi:hypothetical protein
MQLDPSPHLTQHMWSRREIENYLCSRESLLGWARGQGDHNVGPLFGSLWKDQMEASIARIEAAMATLGKGSPWSPDAKVSDDFLDPLFANFYQSLGLPNLMRKTDYHNLAPYVLRDDIDAEISRVLDEILRVCDQAAPVPS